MEQGSSGLLRHVHRERVGWAVPVTVVEDTPDRSMLLRRAGTAIKAPKRSSIGDLFNRLAANDFEVVDSSWEHTDVLEIVEPGRWHSVWPMWAADTCEFLCFYVNFQRPVRRSRFGWDTFDLSLDIVVLPDLTWHWKDEDHFQILQDLQIMSAEEATAVRHDAERVVADITAANFPYGVDWSGWRHDPTWSRPVLPPDWDIL